MEDGVRLLLLGAVPRREHMPPGFFRCYRVRKSAVVLGDGPQLETDSDSQVHASCIALSVQSGEIRRASWGVIISRGAPDAIKPRRVVANPSRAAVQSWRPAGAG